MERVLKQRVGDVNFGLAPCLVALALSLASCASKPPSPNVPSSPNAPPVSPAQDRALIERSIPGTVRDRAGWAGDIDAAFTKLALQPDRENVCAVVAVTEQESNFRVDPVIPNREAVAWREID